MSLRHEMERRHWPADLPDRATVVSVFQAYGGGSHTAVVRNWDFEFWFTCSCGASGTRIHADRDNVRTALDTVEGLANQHVEQTR